MLIAPAIDASHRICWRRPSHDILVEAVQGQFRMTRHTQERGSKRHSSRLAAGALIVVDVERPIANHSRVGYHATHCEVERHGCKRLL